MNCGEDVYVRDIMGNPIKLGVYAEESEKMDFYGGYIIMTDKLGNLYVTTMCIGEQHIINYYEYFGYEKAENIVNVYCEGLSWGIANNEENNYIVIESDDEPEFATCLEEYNYSKRYHLDKEDIMSISQ